MTFHWQILNSMCPECTVQLKEYETLQRHLPEYSDIDEELGGPEEYADACGIEDARYGSRKARMGFTRAYSPSRRCADRWMSAHFPNGVFITPMKLDLHFLLVRFRGCGTHFGCDFFTIVQ